jgi:AraC family transcriptional regulator of adaptative response/methylated-DNA-[protein]-cysteine methyltransferase
MPTESDHHLLNPGIHMLIPNFSPRPRESRATDVLIPLIRAAATLGFAVSPCSLGFVIIAVSEQLIRSIMVGDDPEMLMGDLQSQFPNHAWRIADKSRSLMARVVNLIDRPEQPADLPLDIRGSEFQMRVWQALRDVPAGATVSYASLAEQIGAPNEAGAVVQACAANPLAVAIPCHRAVEANGELVGYRWGLERKRALLAREALSGAPGANERRLL